MNINLKPKKLTRYMRTDLIEASIKKAKDENAVTGVLLLMDSYCTSKCWDFPLLESRIEKQYSVPCQIIQSAGNDAEHVRLRLDTFSEVMKSLM